MFVKWKRIVKYHVINLLRAGQGNHKVALGFVLGFYPCWFPTFGVGPALSVFLARVLRTSVASAIVAAGAGSIAWPVLFFANYKVGSILRAVWSSDTQINELDQLLQEDIPESGYTDTAENINRLGEWGLDFLTGSILNSILFSILFYLGIRVLLAKFRSPLLRMLRPKQSR